MDQLAMILGGRAAKELVFHEITTGAANDLERATAIARQMVTRLGMSEKLGPRVFGSDPQQPFLGRELGAEPSYSEEMAQEIDEEIYRLIDDTHQRAAKVLLDHQTALHKFAAILIERETIDKEQFERLLKGEPASDVLTDNTPPSRRPAPKRDPRARTNRDHARRHRQTRSLTPLSHTPSTPTISPHKRHSQLARALRGRPTTSPKRRSSRRLCDGRT
jgi:cell division protease FtsH